LNQLRRAIGKWDLVGLVLNLFVGAGIFGLPSRVYSLAGVYSLLAYVACAVSIFLIILCFAEVSSRFTETGGPYLYARTTFGPLVGFEVGWLTWLVRLTAFAALCNLFADYLAYFLPAAASGAGRLAVVAAVVTFLATANIVGVRVASLVSNNKNILLETDAAQWLGTGRPLGIPTQSWVFVILTIVAWFVLQRTRFGRQLLLIGANRQAAMATGFRVGQASVVALTLFGLCCGMAGISAASQFGLAVANLFTGLNVDVIAAVLVGGISLRGGQGTPLQAALGAIFIALLQNYMLLHSFTSGQRMLVVGCLVAAATLGVHVIQRRRA